MTYLGVADTADDKLQLREDLPAPAEAAKLRGLAGAVEELQEGEDGGNEAAQHGDQEDPGHVGEAQRLHSSA